MRMTKKQMVKDIFFAATQGQRTTDNFVQGMSVIEAIADNNYRRTIQGEWDWLAECEGLSFTDNAKLSLRKLIRHTFDNLSGYYGPTPRAWAFRDDTRKFDI